MLLINRRTRYEPVMQVNSDQQNWALVFQGEMATFVMRNEQERKESPAGKITFRRWKKGE